MHNQLIEKRKQKGFTQEELAKLVCMEQTTYSRKERGLSPMSESDWKNIAVALGVEIDEIKDDSQALSQGQIVNPTIKDNGVCIGVQYVNVPKEIMDSLLRYNKFLEDELLRARNNTGNNP